MAVVAIIAQNTRLNDAEATTDWGSIGGGAGGALETDFKYQGSNCFARKGATAQRGIFLSDNVFSDLSGAGTYETVLFKFICTTPGLLDLLSVPGMRLEIGSGSTPASPSTDFHFYDVQGSDTYPVDKSWLVIAINPNIASHRTGTTGTPILTLANYYALRYDQSGVSKSPNQGLDAVDIGAGLTMVGGDGADPDGVWQDFLDHDFGTANNRFGYMREAEGAFIVFGNIVIGTATACVLNDTGVVVIFAQGLFAAGFSAITIDLQNATTDVDFTTCTFLSEGTEAGEDTRPLLTVTGTSGAFDAKTSLFSNFASLTLTSACTLDGCTILNCGLITLGEADISDSSILTPTVAADEGAVFDDRTTTASVILSEYDNCEFSQGTNAHHAIRFGVNVDDDLTLTGVEFTGFSGTDDVDGSTLRFDAIIGSLNLNLVNCTVGGVPATTANIGVDDAAGITVTVIIDPVTTLINVKDNLGVNLQNARVLVEAADGTGDFPFEETVTITRSGATASVAHTAHGMVNGDIVVIRGADQQEYNSAFVISNVSANAYDYTVSGAPATPATGTITATGGLIDGLTDASGNISKVRTISTDTPIKGFIRKSSASPRFKTRSLTGNTVDDVLGLTVNVRLILDE